MIYHERYFQLSGNPLRKSIIKESQFVENVIASVNPGINFET